MIIVINRKLQLSCLLLREFDPHSSIYQRYILFVLLNNLILSVVIPKSVSPAVSKNVHEYTNARKRAQGVRVSMLTRFSKRVGGSSGIPHGTTSFSQALEWQSFAWRARTI